MENLSIFLFMTTIAACHKTEIPINNGCNPCDLEKSWIWNHPFDTLSNQDFLTVDPVMYHGNPVYLLYDPWDCIFGSAQNITCLDASTGRKKWGFQLPDSCGFFSNMYLYEDILLINGESRVQGYDLQNRQLLWEIPIQKPMFGSAGLTGIRDKAYLCVEYGSVPDIQATGLLEIDINTGTYREICHLSKEEVQGYPSLNPPSLWQNAAGDSSFLFLTMGRYHYSLHPDKETYALLAYDLKKEKLIWVADSIGIPTNTYRRLEIYEDKVLLPVGNGVQCYDIASGEKQWQTGMPCCSQYNSSFATSRLLAARGRVIAPTNGSLYCLDVKTGKILWKDDQNATNGNNDPLLHNEVVYISSAGKGRLVGFDLFTGQLLMNEASPNQSTNITSTNVILNKEKNLLYAVDFRNAIAFRPVR